MGLSIVKIDSGLFSTPLAGAKEIIKEKRKGKTTFFHYDTEHQPLQFSLTFSLLENFMTPEKKYEIAKWLFKDDFKEFQTTDDLSKVYHVIAINQVEFMSNGWEQGYFTIEFICDASHAWSKTFIESFDLSKNSASDRSVIELTNYSNVVDYVYPEVEFQLANSTKSISLKNLSDEGRTFRFEDLDIGERIYVDNDLQLIQTDNLDINKQFRLGNFNRKWLRLVYGTNRIEVQGGCYLKFRYKFPLYK